MAIAVDVVGWVAILALVVAMGALRVLAPAIVEETTLWSVSIVVCTFGVVILVFVGKKLSRPISIAVPALGVQMLINLDETIFSPVSLTVYTFAFPILLCRPSLRAVVTSFALVAFMALVWLRRPTTMRLMRWTSFWANDDPSGEGTKGR